jgi:2-haloacid dehalogenase
MRPYDLFLFDLDDTLLDFRASERLSFEATLRGLGVAQDLGPIYTDYQTINRRLWKEFEESKTTKEHLKVERFRQIFATYKIEIDPETASHRYLDTLPETVVLIDHAEEICEWLFQHGEIGIITNGIHHVQTRRIKNSKIAPYISFVAVSEEAGVAKPDIRFFEYSSKMAKRFAKHKSLVIGDRVEIDIQGAHNFGVDGCWYNPDVLSRPAHLQPKYEIRHLSEIRKILGE